MFYPAAYVMRCCDWSTFVCHLEMLLLYFAVLFVGAHSNISNLQIVLLLYMQHFVIVFASRMIFHTAILLRCSIISIFKLVFVFE